MTDYLTRADIDAVAHAFGFRDSRALLAWRERVARDERELLEELMDREMG